jgi:hypothetical protein
MRNLRIWTSSTLSSVMMMAEREADTGVERRLNVVIMAVFFLSKY